MFTDHVLRYQDTPGVKMIVVLGEVRGIGHTGHFQPDRTDISRNSLHKHPSSFQLNYLLNVLCSETLIGGHDISQKAVSLSIDMLNAIQLHNYPERFFKGA